MGEYTVKRRDPRCVLLSRKRTGTDYVANASLCKHLKAHFYKNIKNVIENGVIGHFFILLSYVFPSFFTKHELHI